MAETDPYKILGVAKDVSEKDLRSAYRKLAKKFHPDLNPGDKAAEERFKGISVAYDLLSDAEKRTRFDRGEIDAAGQEKPDRQYWRQQAEAGQGARYRSGSNPFAEEDFGDIFAEFARGQQGGARGRPNQRRRGRDESYSLQVSFLDAVRGATNRLTLPDGRTLDVRIPTATTEGQVLRLKGQGGAGINGGDRGDALIEIHVQPHTHITRDGNDLSLDLPVTLSEAVLGGKVTVPTPGGPVAMNIPAGSDTGRRMRLRGKGVPAHGSQEAGDLYVTLKIVLGEIDDKLAEFLRANPPTTQVDPRAALLAET